MTCPDEGTLRGWIDDEPAAHPPGVGAHVTACPHCTHATATLRHEAELAGSGLALLAPPRLPSAVDVETALASARAGGATAATRLTQSGRSRHWSWRPVAAAAVVALAFSLAGTPAGRSAASSFLAQFRSERFVPVSVDARQGRAVMADLAHLGRLTGNAGSVDPSPVASVAAAAARVGFPIARPDSARLPAGVGTTPKAYVSAARQLRFTFDRSKAQAWFQHKGDGAAVALPARFDGASIVVSVPAAALLEYPAADGTPAVLVGQARRIEAHAEGGVSLAEMRSFLLALPGLSESTRRQLASVEDWRTTLPLPIPADQLHWAHTRINGADALLLRDGSGLGSAALWQRGGRIYGVAAVAGDDAVRNVAASLG